LTLKATGKSIEAKLSEKEREDTEYLNEAVTRITSEKQVVEDSNNNSGIQR
jgi:hypothetical protein